MNNIKRRFYLRSCPRCSGDQIDASDIWGQYKECIQCGHQVQKRRRKSSRKKINRGVYVKNIKAA